MKKQNKAITDYWLKYYVDPESGLCALCGNTGIIYIENVITPAGRLLKPGGQNYYCVCPNGQSLRKK